MRIQQLILGACCFATMVFSVSVSPIGSETELTEPEISVVTAFPEENPFGHVVNGEKNKLTLSVENKSERNVTILTVSGSMYHPESDVLVKNLTTLSYGIQLIQGVKINLPYAFYSEFKTGDLRLRVWLEHSTDEQTYRVIAYDSIVTIVEPESSIFDFRLITTYLIVAGFFGGLVYFVYLTYVPQPKRARPKISSQSVSSPMGAVTATGAGSYQEEWIPEHHLKKTRSGKKPSGVVSGTSGDELSGEASGTEGKKRKGRK